MHQNIVSKVRTFINYSPIFRMFVKTNQNDDLSFRTIKKVFSSNLELLIFIKSIQKS